MQITLNSPLDMHLHLRDGEMLNLVAPLSAKYFSGALIMPNLLPPIKTKQDVIAYKQRILEATKWEKFIPYMSVFFHKDLNYEILKELKNEILVVKMYPDGVTTNSSGGVKSIDLWEIGHIFEVMQELEIPLSIHWETNDFILEREKNFLPTYELLASNYPKLKIIMEHITNKESILLLKKYDNLFSTITLHHLSITLDDVIGWMLCPHNFCKPIAKTESDRQALLALALEADEKIMFWSDSAPHPKEKKESWNGSAGVFTAPIILPMLAELFEKHNKLENLEKFISKNAQKIYGIQAVKKEIILEKKDFLIPDMYWNVVPFFAGKTISWSVKE